MRNFAVPVILSILLLGACERVYMQPVPEADRTASNVLSRAAAGDGNAQLEAASNACDTHAGVYESDPSTALHWWKKAAANRDTRISFQAHQQLGEYYLAEYAFDSYHLKEGEATKRPGTYKKVAKCRGERPVRPDYKRAEYHFKKCADGDLVTGFNGLPAAECRHGLGNLNFVRKNYAEALFWYLSVTAAADLMHHSDFDKWLASVKDYRELGLKGSRDDDYARFAAERLSAKQRATVLKRVKAYVGGEMRKYAL